MTAPVLLSALRASDSLGFLAALGIVALSEQGEISPLRLGWRGNGTPTAAVEGPETVKVLGEELREAFERLLQSEGVLPGVSTDFPLATRGVGSDVMRMDREEMQSLYRRFDTAWLEEGNRWPARWLIALAGQAAMRSGSFVDLTPFYAPSGLMNLRSALFAFPLDEARRVASGPIDALTGWVRRNGYSGGNFDSRALRDGAVTTDGRPQNQGAPSPTWLAGMAIRYFPLVDDGRESITLGWHRVALYPRYTLRSLIWPVWRELLEPASVRALLAHPALAVTEEARYDLRPARPADLRGLGVFALFGASRRTLSQGDGPLGPTMRIWSPT